MIDESGEKAVDVTLRCVEIRVSVVTETSWSFKHLPFTIVKQGIGANARQIQRCREFEASRC